MNGIIVWSAQASTSVPTLSEIMMVVLCLLLAVMAYFFMRSRPGANRLMSILLVMFLVGVFGFASQNYVVANPPPDTVTTDGRCNGGTENYDADDPGQTFFNNCQNSVFIVSHSGNCQDPTSQRLKGAMLNCTPGQTLAPSERCYLETCQQDG
ncbi:midcut-by-XrtH protein [Thiocystis minor]|uniref:midcut-by-XrtH protein n=1 Tax=Thiocystis minor TaxID=61597 RepID=UPI00191374A3|nr:midcut-by-XrtH protein [Thiocystis minor]